MEEEVEAPADTPETAEVTEAPAPPAPPPPATKHQRDSRDVDGSDLPPAFLRDLPRGVTHWRIARLVGNSYDPLAWEQEGTGIVLREWPLSELSSAIVRQRWGTGTFRVTWVRARPNGGLQILNLGRQLTLTHPGGAGHTSQQPSAPPPQSAIGALSDTLKIMQVIEQQADRKIQGIAELARVLAPTPSAAPAGFSAAELREAVSAAIAPLQQRIDQLEEGDDDEEEIALPKIGGKGTLPMVLNWAQNNPEVARAALDHIGPIVNNALEAFKKILTPATPSAPVAGRLPDAAPNVTILHPQSAPPEERERPRPQIVDVEMKAKTP